MTLETSLDATMQANKEITRRIHEEAESRGLLDVIDEAYGPEFVDSGHPERGSGPEGVKVHIAQMRRNFRDLSVTVDLLVAEGDWVVARLSSRGIYEGSLAAIAPPHTPVEWSGVAMRRFAGGRVVEQWTRFDMLGVLKQLGIVQIGPPKQDNG